MGSAVAVTIGFLLVVLAGEQHVVAVNPGRLTTSHAGENLSCESCHSQGSLSALFSVGEEDFIHSRAMADSKLCLDCHGEEIGDWNDEARFAHGWDEQERAAVSTTEVEKVSFVETPVAVWLASKSGIRQEGLQGQLACSTCHQEHHGSDASLTVLSNNQCQVCHQDQFHGFGDGHPTFAEIGYPYSRRTRIHFDHETHFGGHFNKRIKFKEGVEYDWPPADGESCRVCHETDPNGEYMKLKGYEATCAKCHDENFVRGGYRMTLLAIPEIETKKVTGIWPTSGHGLNATTRLLLSDDTREYLRGLGEASSESDNDRIKKEERHGELWLNDETRREAADIVAADLQELLFQVWNDGNDVLGQRLEAAGFLSKKDHLSAISGIPAAVFRELLFPGEQDGVGAVAFPALDLTTLNQKLGERDRSIGLWPKASAKLTPLMIEFLSHRDLEYALSRLIDDEEDGAISIAKDGSISLEDLSGASNAEIQAVEAVAWEIKTIFVELDKKEEPFLKRLEALRGGILDVGDSETVLEKIFPSARRDTAFLSGIEKEVERYRQGFDPPKVSEGGSSNAGSSGSATEDDSFADDDFGAGDDDFGSTDNSADDSFGSEEKEENSDDSFGAADDDFATPTEEKVVEQTEEKSSGFRVFEIASVDRWQGSGGWAYDQNAISYAAQRHSDPVMKAWIEAAVAASNSEDLEVKADGMRVLNHTLDWKNGVESENTGSCLQCHTIDRDSESKKLEVNWYGAYGTNEQSNRKPNLTRFSHQKHVISLDCLHCHQPKEDGDFGDFFPRGGANDASIIGPEKYLPTSMTPGEFSPNFLEMNEKALCATCHQENLAGNSCLQCHSYHTLDH